MIAAALVLLVLVVLLVALPAALTRAARVMRNGADPLVRDAPASDPALLERLARIEDAIDAMATQIERLRTAQERRYLPGDLDPPRPPGSSRDDPSSA